MFRSLAYASAIIIVTALPVSAQNLTEQQARSGVAQVLVDGFNKNYKAKNAAGIAAISRMIRFAFGLPALVLLVAMKSKSATQS